MTIAVCFNCGAMKVGAFCKCEECGAVPESKERRDRSLAMSDWCYDAQDLECIGQEIARKQAIESVPRKQATRAELFEAGATLVIDDVFLGRYVKKFHEEKETCFGDRIGRTLSYNEIIKGVADALHIQINETHVFFTQPGYSKVLEKTFTDLGGNEFDLRFEQRDFDDEDALHEPPPEWLKILETSTDVIFHFGGLVAAVAVSFVEKISPVVLLAEDPVYGSVEGRQDVICLRSDFYTDFVLLNAYGIHADEHLP